MHIQTRGIGATLTTTQNTALFTVPAAGIDATLTEIILTPKSVAPAKVTIRIGGRNTFLLNEYSVDKGQKPFTLLSLKTALQPGESIEAWTDVESAVDINLSFVLRT